MIRKAKTKLARDFVVEETGRRVRVNAGRKVYKAFARICQQQKWINECGIGISEVVRCVVKRIEYLTPIQVLCGPEFFVQERAYDAGLRNGKVT
jgi:hypothetical protein